MSELSADPFTMPATVPVPMRRIDTPATLARPNSAYDTVSRHRPQTMMDMIPPAGSATSGSTATPHRGRIARSATTASGPTAACAIDGPSATASGSATGSDDFTCAPTRFASHVERATVTANAATAGTMLAAISDVRSSLNASATAMVLGFGEIMFPALPPPTIAKRSAGTGMPARRPTASATGATVMTAMSTKTPTAVTTSAATATAAMAKRAPSATITASAIFAALPVFTSAPTSTPEASMRRTLGIMLCVPDTIAETVSTSPPPPTSPPTSAPKTSAYAGVTFLTIRSIARARPNIAPHVEKRGVILPTSPSAPRWRRACAARAPAPSASRSRSPRSIPPRPRAP